MKYRFYVPLWLTSIVVLTGACGFDSPGAGAGGGGGGQAANPASERTAEAQGALTAGAGSVGNCNGNPARCAAVNLAAGATHTVALKSDGTVWTWGLNTYGELGDGTNDFHSTPVQVSGLSGVAAVTATGFHSVALKSDGTVWAWGANGDGQLGDGTTTDRLTPVPVSGLGGVTAVAAGYLHIVALKSDGTVWAWGANGDGQLGDGTTTDRLTPVPVSGLGGVTAVSAGSFHTVALKSDGTVWAWGSTYEITPGVPPTVHLTPVLVSGLSGVTAVAAGSDYTVALKSDGTVWAWGSNYHGQLGDGTTIDRFTPVPVSGLGSIIAVAASESHTVALKSDGTVWAWGTNSGGGLGDGTTIDRLTPVPMIGLGSVIAVAAGYEHSVALKSDGTVWACGDATFSNVPDYLSTPFQVGGFNTFPACGSMATCNAATGACVAPPTANWTSCDGDSLTPTATCQNGVCKESAPVVCTGGTDANGVALGPVDSNATICGAGNKTWLCDAAGQWQNVGADCTLGNVPQTPSCTCAGGLDASGAALDLIACGTTVCGGGNKTWLCDASGQWQYGGADCTVGNVPQTPSCTCSGGYDANGTTLGLVACNSTVCGGGYVSYLCDASGQWQNLTTACTLP
jgi:alpha-tubulin suppressor-like RCC1 family protein